MFCSHCGVKVEGQPDFCPNCGEKMLAPAKSSRSWLKYLIGLVLLGILILFLSNLGESDPLDPVKGQLDAINEKKISLAYYNFTTLDFQKSTSLDTFKELIRSNPILATIKSVELKDKQVTGTDMVLDVTLTPENLEPFTMQYNLSKGDDGWRIEGFQKILPATPATATQKPAANDVVAKPLTPAGPEDAGELLVRKHLALLKKGAIKTAFETTVVPHDSSITLEQFQAFVTGNPFLINYDSVSFERAEPVDNLLVVPVIFSGKFGKAQVEYTLESEPTGLLVKGIEILPPATEKNSASTETAIKQILVSLKANSQGEVIDPATTFKSPKGPFYVNLLIANTKPGDVVEVVLESPDLKITSAPEEHKISIAAPLYNAYFNFTTDADVWPAGTYNVRSRLKNNPQIHSTSTFKIE